MVRVARLELAASWSQTRRPTNWATPGYEVKEKFAKWSNMWSREFYHIFEELSTEVIRGNCEQTGEYPTFGVVEPFWCSCSQSRRATNCATPGYISILLYKQACFLLWYPASSSATKRLPHLPTTATRLAPLPPPLAAVASFPNCATPGLNCILCHLPREVKGKRARGGKAQ